MSAADTGGEPWWVVVAKFGRDDYASTTVNAPTAEEAEPEGERVIVGHEGREPERIARVTGPFPNHVPTEEREARPKMCGGCGLQRYCGNHAPTPNQTWWTELEEQSTESNTCWECLFCGTLTYLPNEVTPGGDA